MNQARQRYHALATALLLLAVSWGVAMYALLDSANSVSGIWKWVLTLLSSGAVYRLLLFVAHGSVTRFDFLLAIYWGERLYWKDYWHYTSFRDGKKYLGVWKVDQDIHGTTITAYGLDDQYQHRFTAFSVGEPLPIGVSVGAYRVLFAFFPYNEGDERHPEVTVYARTRFTADAPSGGLFHRGPRTMRGETLIFGGELNGNLNRDVVLVRHRGVRTEEELVARLRDDGIVGSS